MVWLQCDQHVPYGVCGNKTFALVDSVAEAITEAEKDGWCVPALRAGAKRRRVLCPGHASPNRGRYRGQPRQGSDQD